MTRIQQTRCVSEFHCSPDRCIESCCHHYGLVRVDDVRACLWVSSAPGGCRPSCWPGLEVVPLEYGAPGTGEPPPQDTHGRQRILSDPKNAEDLV